MRFSEDLFYCHQWRDEPHVAHHQREVADSVQSLRVCEHLFVDFNSTKLHEQVEKAHQSE